MWHFPGIWESKKKTCIQIQTRSSYEQLWEALQYPVCYLFLYIYIYLNRTSMWNHEIVSSKWCHKTSPPYIYTQAPSVFIIIAFYQFLNGNYCHWGTMNSFINSIIDICIFISSRGSLIIIIHFWVYSVIVETPGGLCGKQSQKLSAFYPQMVKIYK